MDTVLILFALIKGFHFALFGVFFAVVLLGPKSDSWSRASAAWTRAIVHISTYGSATGAREQRP